MNRYIIQAILFLRFVGSVLASDPFVGIWKLDVAKSSGAIPKGETLVVKQEGARLIVEVSVFDADPDSPTATIRYSVPAVGGSGSVEAGPYDGVSIRRVNATTLQTTYLSHGKKVISGRGKLSKDGHTMTVRAKALGSSNQPSWTMVMERQQGRP